MTDLGKRIRAAIDADQVTTVAMMADQLGVSRVDIIRTVAQMPDWQLEKPQIIPPAAYIFVPADGAIGERACQISGGPPAPAVVLEESEAADVGDEQKVTAERRRPREEAGPAPPPAQRLSGADWTEEDVARMRDLKLQGLKWSEIAKIMGRSSSACAVKYSALGLARQGPLSPTSAEFDMALVASLARGEKIAEIAQKMNVAERVLRDRWKELLKGRPPGIDTQAAVLREVRARMEAET